MEKVKKVYEKHTVPMKYILFYPSPDYSGYSYTIMIIVAWQPTHLYRTRIVWSVPRCFSVNILFRDVALRIRCFVKRGAPRLVKRLDRKIQVKRQTRTRSLWQTNAKTKGGREKERKETKEKKKRWQETREKNKRIEIKEERKSVTECNVMWN